MKAVINGKRYDTNTAELIGEYSSPGGYSASYHLEESLFRTEKGQYFLAGAGGPLTKYAERANPNCWRGGSAIILLSSSLAQLWAERHLSAEEVEANFKIEEG